MTRNIFKLTLCALIAGFFIQLFFPVSVVAQRRDYLTDEEIELVRDAQEIDKRIEVLVKAIDRRFQVLNRDTSPPSRKESEKWGELPTGDPGQLLSDIRFLLQKAIDDIDDVAAKQDLSRRVLERESTTDEDTVTARTLKNNEQKFPQAVHYLADAARRYIPQLKAFGETTADGTEQGSINKALEFCQMIIEASSQIARPQKKK